MKKIFSTLLLILLLSTLLTTAGCSCSSGDTGANTSGMSWQENYDLGIRLLSEGKYEEAILAFQAAIQIDPKRAETYMYLADAYIGTGNYEAATDLLLSGMDHVGYLPEFDRQMHYIEFLQSEGVGVHILDVEFDQNTFAAMEETLFTVQVIYRCPVSVDAYLAIGDNSSQNEPYSFNFSENNHSVVTDHDTVSLAFSGIPIQQSRFPYGLAVNLSPTDSSGDTFDCIFFDQDGNITSPPDSEWDEFEPDNFDSETEPPSSPLFSADPDAGLSIEDLTLFGTPIQGLSYNDACAIATNNNFPRYVHSEPGDNYFALYQGESEPSLHLYPNESSADDSLTTIAYLHYMTFDDNGNEIRDPESTPVWTGVRDIYTYDSLNDVLAAFGYSNSREITSHIHSLLQLPAAEADAQLRKLRQDGWCCDLSGVTSSEDSDQILYWSFTWYGEDPQTQKLYSVMFEFHVATDSLTHVTISIY